MKPISSIVLNKAEPDERRLERVDLQAWHPADRACERHRAHERAVPEDPPTRHRPHATG